MFQKYLSQCTEKVIEVLNVGTLELVNLRQDLFTPEFLLLGLIQQDDSVVLKIADELKLDRIKLKNDTLNKIYSSQENSPKIESHTNINIKISPELEPIFKSALHIVTQMQDKYISTGSLFLSLLEYKKKPLVDILAGFPINYVKAKEAIEKLRHGTHINDKQAETRRSVLDQYTTNLNEKAMNGELDPVVGRENEIVRMIQILSRRKKNNPVIVGSSGTGKTALVEGLAQRIVNAEVPEKLLNKRILLLNMTSLVAGAKFKGEYEERLKGVIDEITESAEENLLFIDELHMISSNSGDSMSAANILKPALAKGELKCIGATTFEEYKKHIESDKALARRFQPVKIEEPNIEETIHILHELRPKYEKHHSVMYKPEAIESAAKLSEKYITERFLPDKAIDLIDEAGSKKHLDLTYMPSEIRSIEKEKKKTVSERQEAFFRKDYELAANLQQEILKLEERLNSAVKQWQDGHDDFDMYITPDDIAEIISRSTGIPADRMQETESEKLIHMETNLHKRVIGQNEAIDTASNAIRRNRAGLKKPNRPIGSFLFLGPTGVGKTELAKALAEFLLDDENKLIRIDMSEYMEKHSVAKLIGSPPGYVGYGEGGQLTEKIRRNPYSVVLLDEIEKAHYDVFNILLQILDDGILTDGQGTTVSFKNCLIIGTSNLGGEILSREKATVGFADSSSIKEFAANRKEVMSLLKKTFKPEFLNRIDDIIVFHPLNRDDLASIARLNIGKLTAKLSEQSITLDITDEAVARITERGFSEIYGARPLQREIESSLENPISLMIIENKARSGQTVTVSYNASADTFAFSVT